MAKDAYPLLIPLLLITGLLFVVGFNLAGLMFLGMACFIAFFFRDPERKIPTDPLAIVSPADGKIVSVSPEPDGTVRISIFLSVFNVHINRAPIDGTVENVTYRPGKFRAAFRDAASLENEQNTLIIAGSRCRVKLSQIAGVLARRVVCWKREGEVVAKGERIGLIKFGSRVDISLPVDACPTVTLGEKVEGGSSVIGRFNYASN
jgi:phosphatidylserine decarboxylase